MKLVTFAPREAPGSTRPGLLEQDRVLDLHRANALRLEGETEDGLQPRSLRRSQEVLGRGITDILDRADAGFGQLKEIRDYVHEGLNPGSQSRLVQPRNSITLHPPLDPVSLRDGLCSETHFRNSLEKVGASEIPDLFYERPFYYRTSHTEIGSPGEIIPWPRWGNEVDFELELACVIGRQGRDLNPEQAREAIAGYTIFNDLSIRDYQPLDMSTKLGPSKCKNFRHGNVLGPCIVTADSFDPKGVEGRVRVNEETWTETDNSDMVHSFPELVSFVSQGETLYPGEVIAAGTFAYGCGLELGQYLERGDRVELEIDGIGVLENTVGTTEQ